MSNNRNMDGTYGYMGKEYHGYTEKEYGDMGYTKKEYEMKETYTPEMTMPYGGYGYAGGYGCAQPLPGVISPPIIECPQIKIAHREIIHTVPHIQPIETKIINHHVYKHTIAPQYSCYEENVSMDVYEPPCGYGY